jgi:hypothetical protein
MAFGVVFCRSVLLRVVVVTLTDLGRGCCCRITNKLVKLFGVGVTVEVDSTASGWTACLEGRVKMGLI